ncbi:unnamed protein product [Diatraea saccharalis]|uniref:Uncharacterized protein n=1 Tax=Diatraea saccharalis TaxID=40085 RepID=A0A9P0C822_9NEOP|nr:unnamed protein product [Diatraea saccharalis]
MPMILKITISILGFFNLVFCQMLPMPFPGPSPMAFPGRPLMPYPGSMPNFMPRTVQTAIMPSVPQPLPLPMPMALPQPKLPVVVMPFYDKQKNKLPRRHKKKRKLKRKYISDSSCSDDSDTDYSSSSNIDFRTKKIKHSKGKHRRKQEVLTPVLSYVTKNGYVVYQKKINGNKVKDWVQGRSRYSNDMPRATKRNKMTVDELKRNIYNVKTCPGPNFITNDYLVISISPQTREALLKMFNAEL